MHNLLRYYYRNKLEIWKTIGVIAFILIIIQLMNRMVKLQHQQNNAGAVNAVNNTINNNDYSDNEQVKNSIITNSKVQDQNSSNNLEIIEKFIDYCNKKNIEEAYKLIGKDCKERIFPTINDFYNNYYKDIFTETKSYKLENWYSYNGKVTYKVKIKKDIMSTGQVNSGYIEDYFTVLKENDELKINIKGFIYKENIN